MISVTQSTPPAKHLSLPRCAPSRHILQHRIATQVSTMAVEPMCAVNVRTMQDLYRRLSALETWKEELPPQTLQTRKRRPCRATQGEVETVPTPPAGRHVIQSSSSCMTSVKRVSCKNAEDSEVDAPAAAHALVYNADVLSLVLQHLDLSQLMLIKSVCQSMARVVRRTVSSPSWLRATSGANLQAMRQAFASRSAIFQLPMRVCLERFDWASSRWHRSHGTLLELRAETAPQSIRQFDDDRDACCCRVHHVRFELDGEGAFEGTSRLFRGGSGLGETYDCSGWVPARSRAAGNELLDERHDMLEDADGLGLLRPVAMEAACRALGEIPLLGCRVSELVHSGGLFGDHGRPVAFCGRKRSRDK